MILGFGFLAAAFFAVPMAGEATRITEAHWSCQPPDERTGVVACETSTPRNVPLELGPLMYPVCLALTGIGCLVAAAAVGPRGSGSPAAAPAPPLAPGGPGPAPPANVFAPSGPSGPSGPYRPQRPGPGPGGPYGR